MNTKTTLVMALLAAIIGGYVALVIKPWEPPKKETVVETTAKALFDPKPKDVDRVELTNKNGTFAFKKQDGAWTITAPMNSPAAEYEVNALIDKVGDLKYLKNGKYEQGNKDRPTDSVAGLDKPNATVKLLNGDKTAAEVIIGERPPTGKGTYVKLAGSDVIYECQADLAGAFNRRLENFRDKRLLKFELKDVKRVKAQGLQNFELAQAKDQWTVEIPGRSRADKAAAEKVVRPLSTLSAQEWRDDKPISLKPYNLERPRLKLTVEVSREVPAKAKPGDPNTQPADTQPSTENKTYVLLVGGATENSGNSYFAKLESAPWVFTLPDSTVKELAPPVGDLRDKQFANIEGPLNVTKIEADTPGGPLVLSKPDKGAWQFGDGSPADGAAVNDLINAAQSLRAANFVDPTDALATVDWSKPRAKIVITKRGEANPITLLIGEPTSSNKMVYARNAADEATGVVRASEVEQLLAAPVAYRDRNIITFPRDHASKIELTQGKQPTIVLTKSATNLWSMAQPIAGNADGDAVRNLVADLASLRAKRVVDSGSKEKYGLSQPGVVLTVHTQTPLPPPQANLPATRPAGAQPAGTQPAQGKTVEEKIAQMEQFLDYQRTHPDKENPKATEMLKAEIAKLRASTQPAIKGAPQSTQPAAPTTQPKPVEKTLRVMLSQMNGAVYACRDDSPLVYELDKKIYDDATAEMFDRQVMKFDLTGVNEVGFEHDTVKIVLRKSGKDWKYQADPMLPIDSQKVTDVLNAFRDLKTHRYVSYVTKDLGKYGLDKEVSRVTVTHADGKKVEILLSKKGPDGDADKSRYAVLGNTDRVFLLKGDQAAKFAQKLEDFEKSTAGPGAPGANEMPPEGAGLN